ncbi:MAG: glycerol-3-phosphate dehydrogenase/oxidase, partial [Limnobacter sp.]|nr:glycerol-3-phosphate dehydrogenase/oxidase [Limnobacter sp.]
SHDFASGTSSRSTKLLHGGVRYLAQGNIALVREALTERKTIMSIAPHLAQPLAFVMPTYRWWQKIWYGLGLKLYDLLSGRFTLGKTRFLNAKDTQSALPGVQTTGLRGGVQYWDGQFDDARLCIELAVTARGQGAHLLNYAAVQSMSPLPEGGYKVEVSDQLNGERLEISAPCVVNSTGVWVDQLRAKSVIHSHVKLKNPKMIAPSQGVHLVVSQSFLNSEKALLVPKTQDGRVLFAVPWLGSLILGTTDTPRTDMPREPRPFEQEIEFILGEASKAFNQPIKKTDVKSVWVGLRPLVSNDPSNSNTKGISREHTILLENSGLVSVTGGKWTTYRAMAQEVIDTAIKARLVNCKVESKTRSLALLGAPETNQDCVSMTQPPGLHLFGKAAQSVSTIEGADNQIGLGLSEAMVRYCARTEFAVTVEDILARRWRVLFLDANAAYQMAPTVASILVEETGLDPKLEDFKTLCGRYLLES